MVVGGSQNCWLLETPQNPNSWFAGQFRLPCRRADRHERAAVPKAASARAPAQGTRPQSPHTDPLTRTQTRPRCAPPGYARQRTGQNQGRTGPPARMLKGVGYEGPRACLIVSRPRDAGPGPRVLADTAGFFQAPGLKVRIAGQVEKLVQGVGVPEAMAEPDVGRLSGLPVALHQGRGVCRGMLGNVPVAIAGDSNLCSRTLHEAAPSAFLRPNSTRRADGVHSRVSLPPPASGGERAPVPLGPGR